MSDHVRHGCKLASTLVELRPEQPRPLTLDELGRLHRLGFTTLARQLAAGACQKCGMNKLGTGHRQMCGPEKQVEVAGRPRQPWEPRRARKAA